LPEYTPRLDSVPPGRRLRSELSKVSFTLDEIAEGYRVFGERLDGVLKVAIRP
jgi:hypothetical protein